MNIKENIKKGDTMKTPSQLNTLSIEDHSGHRESARFLSSRMLAAGVTILLFTFVHAEPAGSRLISVNGLPSSP